MNISNIVKIDRSLQFTPTTFIGCEWCIDEQDERALSLTEVDLTEVILESTLEKKEQSIKGMDRLKRLKEKDFIRLDALVFRTLWESQHLIPEKWKESNHITFISFDGTILRNPRGSLYVLSLYWLDGKWNWVYVWLGPNWNDFYLSAGLPTK